MKIEEYEALKVGDIVIPTVGKGKNENYTVLAKDIYGLNYIVAIRVNPKPEHDIRTKSGLMMESYSHYRLPIK